MKAELTITHSDNDGSHNAQAAVKCPYCGEGYQYGSPYFFEVGEMFTRFCDGEEGCDEVFQVTVK